MLFQYDILCSLVAFYCGYIRKAGKTAGIMLSFLFSRSAVLAKGRWALFIPAGIVLIFFSHEEGPAIPAQ